MSTAAGAPVLVLSDVFKVYKEGPVETVALRGVDVVVGEGEYIAICGPSGCGKSTLLSIMAGLTRPTAGRVEVAGQDIAGQTEAELAVVRRRTFGMVFQSDNLFSWMSALENVELGLRLNGRRDARRAAREALSAFGLDARRNDRVARLSGGERQRVAIAGALANQPAVLLADEITGELDSGSAAVVLEALDEVVAGGTAVVAVTHNPEAAMRAARRVDMVDGRIATAVPA